MNAAGPRRVRRPRDKEEIIQRLVDAKEGPFGEIRDALTFAAALGYAVGKRVEFEQYGEPIRWETFKNRRGTEALVGMIALAASDDPEVVADDRFEEQILIFEEYANGGLEVLQDQLTRSLMPARDVVLAIVQEHLNPDADPGKDPLGLGA